MLLVLDLLFTPILTEGSFVFISQVIKLIKCLKMNYLPTIFATIIYTAYIQ